MDLKKPQGKQKRLANKVTLKTLLCSQSTTLVGNVIAYWRFRFEKTTQEFKTVTFRKIAQLRIN